MSGVRALAHFLAPILVIGFTRSLALDCSEALQVYSIEGEVEELCVLGDYI